jgi:hypothetical protein
VARTKDWFRAGAPSGTVPATGLEINMNVGLSLVEPTLLRTRAYVGLTYVQAFLPPFNPGNSFGPLALRLVWHDSDIDLPPSWWDLEDGLDDVTVHPIIWEVGEYVPANADFGRPETRVTNGYLAGGVVDVAGQRHIDGEVTPQMSGFVGAILGTATAAQPEFSTQWWISVLVEHTV